MHPRNHSPELIRPIIGLTANRIHTDGVSRDWIRLRYIYAVVELFQAIPVIIPTLGSSVDFSPFLKNLDGIILTGDESNIDPQLYNQKPEEEALRDLDRDETSFHLIEVCLATGIPLFGICRGLQELNVFFGGTLYQSLVKADHKFDHRENVSLIRDRQYLPVHDLTLNRDGMLYRIFNRETIRVNSLHNQGIENIGEGLAVEAVAEDGLVEAVSYCSDNAWILAVQWHPEWYANTDMVSKKILIHFGQRCSEYAVNHREPFWERTNADQQVISASKDRGNTLNKSKNEW